VFQVGGFVPNLCLRALYGDVIGAIIKNRHSLPIKVGINAYNDEEWTELARYLHMDKEKANATYVAGDFSNFDKMLSAQLLETAFWILDKLYETGQRPECFSRYVLPEDRLLWQVETQARAAMRNWVVRSVHIGPGFKYWTDHGNPSGNVLTTTLNSICNWLLTDCCLNTIVPEYEQASVQRGDLVAESVPYKCANFGDDLVIYNGGDSRINQDSMTQQFAKWNIKFTNAQKSMDGPSLLMSDQVEFLKRSFVREGHMFTGPLRLESIRNMIYYCNKKNARCWHTMEQMLSSALVEMVMHGREQFTAYRTRVLNMLTDHLQSPFHNPSFERISLLTWDEARRVRESHVADGPTFIC
jgi:hypothetical protein